MIKVIIAVVAFFVLVPILVVVVSIAVIGAFFGDVRGSVCDDGVFPPVEIELDEGLLDELAIEVGRRPLGEKQIELASIIVGVGISKTASQKEIRIVLMDAMERSRLRNLEFDLGLGLFRFDPELLKEGSTEPFWGTPDQLLDAIYSTNRVYRELATFTAREGLSLGEIAAAIVLDEENVNAYGAWEDEAESFLSAVDDSSLNQEPYEWSEFCDATDRRIGSSGSGPGGDGASRLAAEMRDVGYQNGRLPDEILVNIGTGRRCLATTYAGAAEQAERLMEAARQDGQDIEAGWCYRTAASQESAWLRRMCYIKGNCDGDPYPVTSRRNSRHGWALAIDFWSQWNDLLRCDSPEYKWMLENALKFGFVQRRHHLCDRPTREPWHWEFAGVVDDTPVTGEPTSL